MSRSDTQDRPTASGHHPAGRAAARSASDRVSTEDRPRSIGSALGGSAGRGLRDTGRTTPTIGSRRRAAAFWSVAYAHLVIMLGTTLPSPLYGLYQDRFTFNAGMLTIIFAAYAGGVMIALLLYRVMSHGHVRSSAGPRSRPGPPTDSPSAPTGGSADGGRRSPTPRTRPTQTCRHRTPHTGGCRSRAGACRRRRRCVHIAPRSAPVQAFTILRVPY